MTRADRRKLLADLALDTSVQHACAVFDISARAFWAFIRARASEDLARAVETAIDSVLASGPPAHCTTTVAALRPHRPDLRKAAS